MLTEAQLKLLDEIAPWWAKRIRKGNLKPTRTYTLGDPDKCVVGEAHQSRKKSELERYWLQGGIEYCFTCDNQGMNMHQKAKPPDYDINRPHYIRTPAFDTQVGRFLTHFVKVHRKSAV